MPRVAQKADSSLKYLSLQNIAKFIDKVWCDYFIKHMYGLSHWRFVVGPFDILPPHLIHAIFVHLKDQKLLRKHHVYLLISPYAKKLDFSGCVSELSLMLTLSGQRAVSARTLDLSSSKIPKNIFSETLPQLQKLSVLSLSHTNITDDLLVVVGLYCPDLQELDISYTTVSDKGLISLFAPVDLSGNKNERFGNCSKISKLSVTGCQKISEDGAFQAVQHLKTLQVFDYQNTVGVLEMIVFQKESSQSTLHLKSLYACSDTLTSDSLAVAVSICPMAEYVYLVTFPNMTQYTTLALLDLLALKELHIRNELNTYCLPFLTSCSPVLVKHGETLVSINLAEIEEVSVPLIRDHCPNLLHLALLWNRSFVNSLEAKIQENGIVSRSFFPVLRTVKVACIEASEDNAFTDILYEDLKSILMSPELGEVSLSRCENVTDQMMWEVWEVNKMDKVVKFDLERCHNVTMEGLENIIDSQNCLEYLGLEKCEKITKRDVQEYNKKVKRRKWNLKVVWS